MGNSACNCQARDVEDFALELFEQVEKLPPPLPIQSVHVDNITGRGPFLNNWSGLPEALRGVFWLTEQGKQSTLMSFGGPNNDTRGGFSTGRLREDGNYAIRLGGDRCWAFGRIEGTEHHGDKPGDKTYLFHFDDIDDPTSAEIIMYNPETDIYLDYKGIPGWSLQFWMELRSKKQAKKAGFPNSTLWLRKTSLLWGPLTYDYKLVQVIDEHWQRLEPAWSQMVEYMNEHATPPGTVWYRAAQPWTQGTARSDVLSSFELVGS